MTSLFYRNPRLTVLTVCLILVSGLSAYLVLPRLEDPVLRNRFALIKTRFPGATPERVESLVTEKVEDELKEVEEIKVLESTSSPEVSVVQVELRDEITDVDNVWSRVRDKLDDVLPELPEGALEPEFEEQDARAYAMIVGLAWDGPGAPNHAILRRRAEELEDLFRAIPGTEDVELFGDPDEEIIVEIDPARLVSLSLTPGDVSRQLQSSDARIAAGQLRSARDDLLLEISNDLDTLARVRRTPVRLGDGTDFVCVEDVATVRKGIREPVDEFALIGGKPGIALAVFVLRDRRIDRWAVEAREAVESFDDRLPDGLAAGVVFDQSRYTEQRLDRLLQNMFLGALAVVAVVLLLMGWRSALLVGAALPLSALMVFAGMRVLGVPIHQMSVTGLIIALGLLIDNAIVMVDEVGRELRTGQSKADAISASVRKLAVPLLGSTLTTTLAFAPIALMPGPAGEFVGSIAISVILALFSSLFLAMTIVPTLTAWVRGSAGGPHLWHAGFSSPALTRVYRSSLSALFRRPVAGVCVGLLLPVAGFVAGGMLQEQFFPPSDRDQVHIEFELPAQSSLAETRQQIERARQVLVQHRQVEEVHWFVGKSAPGFYYNLVNSREYAANYAQALVQLDSDTGVASLIHQLQQELDTRFAGARVLVRQLEQGPPFPAPIELRIYGPDVDTLQRLGAEARLQLTRVPDVIHTRAALNEALPKLGLQVDEDELRLAGLDNSEVARQLNATLEGAVGGSVLEETEELPVRVRVADTNRSRVDRILSLEVLPAAGDAGGGASADYVPLSAVANLEFTAESSAILRRNGRRVNTVQGYTTAGVLPSDALDVYESRLQPLLDKFPPGYSWDFGGEASKRDDAVGNLMSSVGVLMVLMVATLVLSFSSFRMAAIIGAVGVLSVGLGLLSLWLFGYPFGFMAIIGTMGLVGVALNDAIVVLAAIRNHSAARHGDAEAVGEVVVEETRHVLATTLTTMAGFLPLLMAGGGFWPPLAISIAGGVGGATILALYFVPSAYVLLMCPLRRTCGEPVAEAVRIDAAEPPPWRRRLRAGFATLGIVETA